MRSASFRVGTTTLALAKSSGVGVWGSTGGWRLGPFNRRESRIAAAGTWISSNRSDMALSIVEALYTARIPSDSNRDYTNIDARKAASRRLVR